MGKIYTKKSGWTGVLLALTVLTGLAGMQSLQSRKDLVYAKALEKVAVSIDQKELTLYDMAFYVAYQEKEVQKDAVIYNPEKPHRYWNAHTNGSFIRVVAEKAVIDMAVHDEIFYQLACKEELVLDERETEYLANEILDFCSDITSEQLAQLGVTEEDIKQAMQKIALANKYQSILAQIENKDYAEYDYTGSAYTQLLTAYTVEVNESVWDRISIGNITVNYK